MENDQICIKKIKIKDVPTHGSDWKGARTLDDFIMDMVIHGKMNSPEFETMIRVYGKPKIDRIIKKHQKHFDWEW